MGHSVRAAGLGILLQNGGQAKFHGTEVLVYLEAQLHKVPANLVCRQKALSPVGSERREGINPSSTKGITLAPHLNMEGLLNAALATITELQPFERKNSTTQNSASLMFRYLMLP